MDTKRVTIECPFFYDSFTKKRLLELIEEQFARVPEEYRDAAEIEFEVDYDYDGLASGLCTISYWRPLTNEEKGEKAEAARQEAARQEARERHEFERLKKKFS